MIPAELAFNDTNVTRFLGCFYKEAAVVSILFLKSGNYYPEVSGVYRLNDTLHRA